jgi:hypothetical protein
MSTTGRLAALLLFPIGAAFADSDPETFVVHTANGVDFSGTVTKLAVDGSVTLGSRVISAADIVTIRRSPLRLPDYPDRAVVVLTGGNRVPVDPEKPLKLEDGRLYFHVRPNMQVEPLRIPRAFVALLWLAPPEGIRDPELLTNQLLNAKRLRDVLLLRNGDQLAGTVTSIDRVKGVRMDTNGRAVTIALAQVSGIAFDTELQARSRRPKTYTHVVLANGGRLGFSTLQLEAGAGKSLAGKTLFGARLDVPLSQVAALEPRRASVIYLSDLKPKRFEHTPFLSVSWPLALDAAVSGRPLRVGGNTFDKGLGMHTKSRVTYALDGDIRWFEASIGLDDRISRRGRARIGVLVDGKEQGLGADNDLTGKSAPLAVRINVHKARELTLLVDFGSYGDVQAHVNWADARLLR